MSFASDISSHVPSSSEGSPSTYLLLYQYASERPSPLLRSSSAPPNPSILHQSHNNPSNKQFIQMIEREQAYFKHLFSVCKAVAFHEIYMEAAREDLCKDEYYDPLTAFKSLDSFKHNKVIPYELFSFFELHRIESTAQECEQIIQALNKSLTQLDYESFEELTLPRNTVLRNLALTRFSRVKIEVGSYSRLTYVKEHSEHLIALFLEKELNFCREYLFLRQEFSRKWGGDIYTALQKVFKEHKKSRQIGFEEFANVARGYGILFNQNEYYAMWKRSKKRNEKVEELGSETILEFQQLLTLLLANNFKTKARYGLQHNIPIEKSMQRPQPSYKVSHWKEHQIWQQQQKQQQLQKLQQRKDQKVYDMKYRLAYPQLMGRWQTKQKTQQIIDKVDKMSDRELIQAYHKATTKKTIFRQ